MKFEEKISKKNPPIKPATIPVFFLGFSKTLISKTEIRIKFGTMPQILKWIKKLVCSKANK